MSTPVGLPKATARVDSRLKLTFGKLVSKATIGATTTGTRGRQVPPNFWVGGTGNVLVPFNFLVNLNFQYVHVVCVNVIYFKSFFVCRSTHQLFVAWHVTLVEMRHCKGNWHIVECGSEHPVTSSAATVQRSGQWDRFQALFEKAAILCRESDVPFPELPWQRRPPKRLCGPAPAHTWTTPEEYFRSQFSGCGHCSHPAEAQVWPVRTAHVHATGKQFDCCWQRLMNWRPSYLHIRRWTLTG